MSQSSPIPITALALMRQSATGANAVIGSAETNWRNSNPASRRGIASALPANARIAPGGLGARVSAGGMAS